MPLNINNILSSSIDSLGVFKKTSGLNSILNNKSGDSNSSTEYFNKLKNLNIDAEKTTNILDLMSDSNIDRNQMSNDFLKINNSGIKFSSISDLKNQDLSKLDLDRNFFQNLNKMQSRGLNILDIFNLFLKIGTIGGLDKLDNLFKKTKDEENSDKKDKKEKVKRENIKLPNPGETSILTIYEDQLPDFEKLLKKNKFSKLFGDEYKSVLSLISPDSNISSDDSFAGKYMMSYFVGNKSESLDLAQKGAISKITIDQNQISLKCDYNKNVDMVTHHIHIVLLKNIKPTDQKLEKTNKDSIVSKFEKNLKIDKERGIKILVPSQYLDVFQTSKWGGYKSFVTTKFSKQMVWYDNAYDRSDFYPNNITNPSKKNRDGSSNFDIGVHMGPPGKTIGNWNDDGSHCFETVDGLNDFFELCEKHSKLHGNKFTYTLATKDDFEKAYRDDQIVKEEQRKKDEELAKIAAENKAKNEQANTVVNNNNTVVDNNTNPVVDNTNKTVKPGDHDDAKCKDNDCWTQFGKESFWNGVNTVNGKKVPEIKIQKSETLFTITYKGAGSGFILKYAASHDVSTPKGLAIARGDTLHQLLNVLTFELNPHLKQYKLKPVIKDIKMEMKSNSLVVSVPLIKSPTSKAFFINRRGGWGHDPLKPSGKIKALDDYRTKPHFEGLATHKTGSLTEHFVTFELS